MDAESTAGPKAKGLESSMWAHDFRSRSLPPSNGRASPPRQHSQQHQHQQRREPPAGPHANAVNHMPPEQAFRRFEQACHRLRWKFIDLQASYHRALHPAASGFAAADAEMNFKIDFYEFYAWIEQALVLVLRVFNVSVPRSSLPARTAPASSSSSSSHAYHHDVLACLADPANPLHGVFGAGDVYQALWKAKDLRNRWKYAAEGGETPPLKMYDLGWIVGEILAGLEVVYGAARERVAALQQGGGREGDEEGEEEWAWMVEAMDWEA
ncbi:hypothetical protein S7711_03868 [Stachybotrys chartarum IBT 7711]|uniref:Uncharacterized protein n=1 Tax=Stachybotrys chartarum (strain CBS 109288 / IBT 7711) TaxID=1280523 RepID=A0A084AHU6_STACB|nr:hypothetical protein S7711_03868 [Stachybotrys chartarum IBT 7711]KFA53506.1 hypothetical protein S40293_06518 [Stachybotrys chartarum IBT 40293]KFA76530.1 hypothetical protein S40288_01553 [Stachybotrys chartarum IBT 40288]